MHLYTAIQIICLIIIYAVKYFKRTALAFPFILMLFILLRQFFLKKIFTEKELKALDGDDETNNENGWLEKDFFEDAPLPV
ncbi:unnamed protein product [Brugia pahangi]|nr:unnamed protein product [Brugia pahangi]